MEQTRKFQVCSWETCPLSLTAAIAYEDEYVCFFKKAQMKIHDQGFMKISGIPLKLTQEKNLQLQSSQKSG